MAIGTEHLHHFKQGKPNRLWSTAKLEVKELYDCTHDGESSRGHRCIVNNTYVALLHIWVTQVDTMI